MGVGVGEGWDWDWGCGACGSVYTLLFLECAAIMWYYEGDGPLLLSSACGSVYIDSVVDGSVIEITSLYVRKTSGIS